MSVPVEPFKIYEGTFAPPGCPLHDYILMISCAGVGNRQPIGHAHEHGHKMQALRTEPPGADGVVLVYVDPTTKEWVRAPLVDVSRPGATKYYLGPGVQHYLEGPVGVRVWLECSFPAFGPDGKWMAEPKIAYREPTGEREPWE